MRFSDTTLACLVLTAALLPAQASPLTVVERTTHFAIRCRPGSRAEASLDRVASLVEGDLARILRELGLKEFKHTIELFLYDDERELQAITGVPAGGYSVPLASHVPQDNDQTRVHELVHVVATTAGSPPRLRLARRSTSWRRSGTRGSTASCCGRGRKRSCSSATAARLPSATPPRRRSRLRSAKAR